jgi:CRP/FNR family transcriptional regulator, cyclic AMP receptor protein
MTLRTLEQTLPEHPFFEGFDAEVIALLAGCARNLHFRPDELVFRAGERADHFYLVREGRVAIQVHEIAGGASIIDTVDSGEVLGFSWLVPPYRWVFDARATVDTRAVGFDADCLRAKCDADPAVGFALLSRVALIMHQRLEAARVRLLDLYGQRPR